MSINLSLKYHRHRVQVINDLFIYARKSHRKKWHKKVKEENNAENHISSQEQTGTIDERLKRGGNNKSH